MLVLPPCIYLTKKKFVFGRSDSLLQTMRNRPPSAVNGICGGDGRFLQRDHGKSPPSPSSLDVKVGKQQSSTTNRAHKLFCDFIMPLSDDDVYSQLPEKTIFIFTEEDILTSTLMRIDQKCPQLFTDRAKFMATVESIVFGPPSH